MSRVDCQEEDSMSTTKLSIKGDKFLINESLVYSEIDKCSYKGLLMNARFIQGVFDLEADADRFNRFGKVFDPEVNTNELIDHLPQWYEKGLRAITVGFQGGGPCFTIKNNTMKNHPYCMTDTGMVINEQYQRRMLRIIEAADAIGMVIIVSCFYPGQVNNFENGAQIIESVKAACRFINESGRENIILEICNEFDLCRKNPLIGTGEGMATLIHTAKQSLDKAIPVGSSLSGGEFDVAVAKASDVVLIHGNGCSRQRYYNLIQTAKKHADGKPVLCNEDSQCIGNMLVSMDQGVSWGYYNNMTKQEPPVDWGITKGEDDYFARRLSFALGLVKTNEENSKEESKEDQYYLQGIDENQTANGEIWPRLASMYPEKIDCVQFYLNDSHIYTCYNEPFTVNYHWNWKQFGLAVNSGDHLLARVHLRDGAMLELEKNVNL